MTKLYNKNENVAFVVSVCVIWIEVHCEWIKKKYSVFKCSKSSSKDSFFEKFTQPNVILNKENWRELNTKNKKTLLYPDPPVETTWPKMYYY